MTFENLRYWPLIVGGCSITALLMVLAYLRSSRPINSPTRFLLAALRVLMVGVILFCLLQPVVTETVTFTERSPFFVLVDLSTSMEIKDCGSGRSRRDVTVSVLDSVAGQLDDMRTQHNLQIVGFGKEPVSIADPEDLPPADMSATAIGDALESLLRKAKGRAHGGVLMFSDGTNNHGRTPTPYGQYFKEAGLPIFPVLLGDSTPTGRVRDIKVFSLNCPNSALVGTSVSVLAEVSFLGYKGKSFPVRLKLGEEVAQVRTVDVTHDQQAAKLAFLLPVEKEGQHQVSVEVEYQEAELDSRNNKLTTILNVGKETISVCYIETRLRWERKFLLRILSEMEGLNVDARMLPAEPSERERFLAGLDFSRYKAIILGDVSADTLGASACQRIYDAVAQSGCGIAILGGPNSFGLGGYPDSPLYALSPVRMATNDAYERRSVRVGLTRVGQTHFVTALKEDRSENKQIWASLPEIDGVVGCAGLKSAAFVLAQSDDQAPLIAVHEVGKGRAVAVLSDGFWKWCLAADENSRFVIGKMWRQSILWLARRDLKGERRFWLTLDRFLFFPGERVDVRAQAENEDGTPVTDANVEFSLKAPGGEEVKTRASFFNGYYQASFFPAEGGEFALEGSAAQGETPIGKDSARIFVNMPDPEKDSPMADHALLGFLSEQSGGRMLKPEETERFLEDWKAGDHLAVVEKTTKRSLWDQPYIIIAFALLIAIEWAIRRWSRLV